MRHDKISASRQGVSPSIRKPSLAKGTVENSLSSADEGAEEAKVTPFTLQHFFYCGRDPRKPR
ncbi:hypothetical protein BH10PSE13_BH10PSE13_22380 [soil metagenome]